MQALFMTFILGSLCFYSVNEPDLHRNERSDYRNGFHSIKVRKVRISNGTTLEFLEKEKANAETIIFLKGDRDSRRSLIRF
ncbi:MAG: hypothetical protein C5B52_17920 [Bacteroidetes bacterium]|nr:MAG: hypothetical protein C5B52_17920 [Bacteroidota bacterium]